MTEVVQHQAALYPVPTDIKFEIRWDNLLNLEFSWIVIKQVEQKYRTHGRENL